MKKTLLWVIMVVVCISIVTVFAGCSGAATEEPTEEPAEEPAEEEVTESKPYEGITLSFAAQGVPLMNKAIELLPEFELKTGIKVVPDLMPFDSLVQKITIDCTTRCV